MGQTVVLQGTIVPGNWEFTIRGVYTPEDPSFGEETFFFHYDYLYEMTSGRIRPGWYILGLDEPDRAPAITAQIDAMFENSSSPTKTQTERAWQTGFITMWGNVEGLVRTIGGSPDPCPWRRWLRARRRPRLAGDRRIATGLPARNLPPWRRHRRPATQESPPRRATEGAPT